MVYYNSLGPSSSDCMYIVQLFQASPKHKFTVTSLTPDIRQCGWDPPPYGAIQLCSLIRGFDVKIWHFGQFQMKKKRAPAPLVLRCLVCSAPAPEHLHFGGKWARKQVHFKLWLGSTFCLQCCGADPGSGAFWPLDPGWVKKVRIRIRDEQPGSLPRA